MLPSAIRPIFQNALILVVGFVLTSQPVQAQNTSLYQVDPQASRVYIKVTTTTRLGHNHGVEGRLTAGQTTLGGAGTLVFDMTSFTADTPEARRQVGLAAEFSASDARKATANMRSKEVLDVEHYPQATYVITAATPADGQKPGEPGHYRFTGRFTLHGATQPVEFKAKVEPADRPGSLRVRGTFALLQTAYGIRPYSALGGFVGIADRLDIWGDLLLVPAAR